MFGVKKALCQFNWHMLFNKSWTTQSFINNMHSSYEEVDLRILSHLTNVSWLANNVIKTFDTYLLFFSLTLFIFSPIDQKDGLKRNFL